MSGFLAVHERSGRPIEEGWLRARAAAWAKESWSGNEGQLAVWTDGAVGFAWWSGPSRRTGLVGRSPVIGRRGRLFVVGEVRIDDREPLVLAVEKAGLLPTASDADLVLAAYELWGHDCPRHLLGDFAFVLWDGARRELFAARDVLGVRQLCHLDTGSAFWLASRPGALLAATGPRPLDLDFLADQLARRYERWVNGTVYQGVKRLPPGHALVAVGRRVTETRCDHLGARPVSGPLSEEEWAEALRERLSAAVASRLQGTRAGLLVSGGLDSSALAGLAEGLLAGGTVAADAKLFSYRFERTPRAEEGAYFEAVAAHCPHLLAARVPADDLWALREMAGEGDCPTDEPEVEVSRGLLTGLLDAVAADGRTVTLAGNFADQAQLSNAYEVTSLLRDLPRRRLGTELPHFLRRSRHPRWAVRGFAYLHPLVPGGLQPRVAGWFDRRWRPAFTAAASGPRVAGLEPRWPSAAARSIHAALTDGGTAAALAGLDSVSLATGIDLRFPFLDRRVLELLLSVPGELCCRDGVNKLLLRRALSRELPPAVRERRTAAYFDELIDRGLKRRERAKVHSLIESPIACRLGLVAPERLATVARLYLEGTEELGGYRDLAAFLCVESWLRQHEKDLASGADALPGSAA